MLNEYLDFCANLWIQQMPTTNTVGHISANPGSQNEFLMYFSLRK